MNKALKQSFQTSLFIGNTVYEELDAATAARRGLGTVPSRNPFLKCTENILQLALQHRYNVKTIQMA